jgi:hypothetical protein
MSITQLTDTEALALSGVTNTETRATHTVVGQFNHAAARKRLDARILELCELNAELEVYKDTAAATTVGIGAGRRNLGNNAVVYAGGTVSLSAYNNATGLVWLYSNSGTATIGTGSSWPSYPHWKLAEVTIAAGVITGILDRRNEGLSDVVIRSGSTGSRPAAGTIGQLYWNTTTTKLNVSTGSAWVLADGTSA